MMTYIPAATSTTAGRTGGQCGDLPAAEPAGPRPGSARGKERGDSSKADDACKASAGAGPSYIWQQSLVEQTRTGSTDQ